jgi:hypothetical protein
MFRNTWVLIKIRLIFKKKKFILLTISKKICRGYTLAWIIITIVNNIRRTSHTYIIVRTTVVKKDTLNNIENKNRK